MRKKLLAGRSVFALANEGDEALYEFRGWDV
jgi:hypothetical protein